MVRHDGKMANTLILELVSYFSTFYISEVSCKGKFGYIRTGAPEVEYSTLHNCSPFTPDVVSSGVCV